MERIEEIELPYQPFDKQQGFHDSTARNRAIITGVGFGKSAAGVNEMIRESIRFPGTLNLIFAPTYPMLKNTTMREFKKFCPPELIAEHNMTNHIIRLINGTEIVYLSGDNETDIDRLRGLTLGCAYGDEISLCPYYFWEIIVGRVRDIKGSHRIWVTTTPKGFTWLYDLFVQKRNPKNQEQLNNANDYQIFTGTTFDNPYTADDYKEGMKNIYSGIFSKQEIYGEFVGFEGLVYPEFSRNIHIIKTLPEFKKVVCGVDFGYTNPSVLLVLGIDGDDRVYAIEEFYERRVLMEDLIKQAKMLKDKYKIQEFFCDPSEPEHITMMRQSGLNARSVKCEIMSSVKNLATRLKKTTDNKPRFFISEKCVNTIVEFENYRYPDVKSGKPEQENPIKLYDHAADALRYACWDIDRKGHEIKEIGSLGDMFKR